MLFYMLFLINLLPKMVRLPYDAPPKVCLDDQGGMEMLDPAQVTSSSAFHDPNELLLSF